MKITSADCVRWIVAEQEPWSDPKDWKRINKRKASECHIVRQFKHRATGLVMTVHEWIENGESRIGGPVPESEKIPSFPSKPQREVTEQDCIRVLEISGAGPWVFLLSYPVQGDVIWTFAKTTGGGTQMTVDVMESQVRSWMIASDEASKNPIPCAPPKDVKASDWAAIKANPITVDLSRAIFPKPTDKEYQGKYGSAFQSRDGEWSGRVIYGLNYIDDECVSFFCGPEEKDGNLEDTLDGGVADKLRVLLADMNPDIMTAENLHDVPIIEGASGKGIWMVIEERLQRSGAVKMRKAVEY